MRHLYIFYNHFLSDSSKVSPNKISVTNFSQMEVKYLEDTCLIRNSTYVVSLCILVRAQNLNDIKLWYILTQRSNRVTDENSKYVPRLSTKCISALLAIIIKNNNCKKHIKTIIIIIRKFWRPFPFFFRIQTQLWYPPQDSMTLTWCKPF